MNADRKWIRPSRAAVARAMAVLWAAAGIVVGTAGHVAACEICFRGRVVTIGQQLDAADQAVLAIPAANGNNYRIIAVVKGGFTIGADLTEPVAAAAAQVLSEGKPLLLLRNRLGQQWMSVGTIGAEHADWLQQLAATYRGAGARPPLPWPRAAGIASDLTDMEWRERAALAVTYLENADPMAADIAYGEISRAPYPVLRSLRSRLSASSIDQWIGNPDLAARRSTYLLLLGIAGGKDEAAHIESRIDAKWQARDAVDLAAMLAAELELLGAQRVERIEQRYLVDRSRTLPEIEAALLALSVHGNADSAVPRSRVIAAYRLFMRERKPMAGFVAQELADWEYWDATTEYVAIIKSDAVKDPASHFMIINYLRRSPQAAAKAALSQPEQAAR